MMKEWGGTGKKYPIKEKRESEFTQKTLSRSTSLSLMTNLKEW